MRSSRAVWVAFTLAVGSGLVACGDDDDGGGVDSGPEVDGGTSDDGGESDTGTPGDDGGPPDSGTPPACPITGALALPTTTVTGRLSGASANVSTTCTSAGGTGGPEQWYSLRVTERTGVRFSVTSSFPVAIAIRAVCDDPLTEVACGAPDPSAPPPPPGEDPPGGALSAIVEPGDYFVLIDTIGFGVGGDYELTVQAFEPPLNATCATAIPLTPDTPLTGQDPSVSPPTDIPCGSPGARPLFYTLTVPPAHRASVTSTWVAGGAEPPPFGGPDLTMLAACGASGCVGEPSGPARVAYSNETTSPETLIVVASAPSFVTVPPGTTFDLLARVTPLSPNRECGAAAPLAIGGSATGLFELGTPGVVACAPTAPPVNGVHYYTVTIPAGARFAATVSTLGFDPWIALLPSCGATTCLAESAFVPSMPGGGSRATVRYTNVALTPLSAIVAVGTRAMAASVEFTVSAGVVTPATNLTCAAATTVVDGDSLILQDASTATTSLASVCEAGATGGNLFYRASVPPGEVLSLLVQADGWIPLLRLLGSCAATTCGSIARGGPGGAARIEYGNVTAAPVDVIVAVGPDGPGAGGLFDLRARIGPSPYLTTPIAAATCDDTSTGTAISGVTGDDTASALAPLPFAFELFGDAVTHYGVSSNGFVQLFPSSVGTVALPAFLNTVLPDPNLPNGMIAALWTDLRPGPSGSVRALTTGTAPNRQLTLEWAGFERYGMVGTNVRMQVKLFEATGIIEVHHCTLTGFDAGARATVGLEELTAARGVQTVFDTPGAVVSGTGVRYTPPAP